MHGSLTCEKDLRISGSGHIDGAVSAAAVHISGSGHLGGSLTAEILHTSGAARIDGKVSAGEIASSGSAAFGGDVEAEAFTASGSCKIPGLLNAETVELHPGKMTIGSIGGSTIRVTGPTAGGSEGISLKLFGMTILSVNSHGGHAGAPSLTADTIEGDDITLEFTTARVVRGRTVIVGQGCCIDRVEYSQSLDIREDGQVKESAKTN